MSDEDTEEDPHVEWSEGAEAGLRQVQTGDSGCPVLHLTWDEVLDLALSGRAFGRATPKQGQPFLVEIVDKSRELRKLPPLWRRAGQLRTLKPGDPEYDKLRALWPHHDDDEEKP